MNIHTDSKTGPGAREKKRKRKREREKERKREREREREEEEKAYHVVPMASRTQHPTRRWMHNTRLTAEI